MRRSFQITEIDMSDKFLKARCWDELPQQAKDAMKDQKVGETAHFIVRDDENPLLSHEHRLTLISSVEITKEQYEQNCQDWGGDMSPVVRRVRHDDASQ
jgi:hypothetical protein